MVVLQMRPQKADLAFDHKLRIVTSLELDSEFLEICLKHCFDKLLIFKNSRLVHII